VQKTDVPKGYEELHKVLMRALDQAATGKGKERHANDDPFEEQIMCYMAGQLGLAAPVFQVVKKSVEACRLPYPANVNELLGAINYAAGAVIEAERKAKEAANASTNEFLAKAKAEANRQKLIDALKQIDPVLKQSPFPKDSLADLIWRGELRFGAVDGGKVK